MKTLIAIPCMDMVHTEFMKSLLGMRRVGETKFMISCSSLIYDARNAMARKAVNEGYDRILWLDSDMSFDPDLMERLSAHLDDGKEFISGIYFTRKAPVRPVLYKECGYYDMGGGSVSPKAVWYDDYPKDSLFPIKASGFGGVMLTTELIKKVADQYGLPFAPMLGFGEDLSFCARATECGAELWCDSTIKMGHVGLGTITENVYLSQGGSNGHPIGSQTGPENNDNGI